MRLLACWLQAADVLPIIERIEAHDAAERAAIRAVADKNGVVERYVAERAAFPCNPEPRRCGYCPYKPICEEAKAVVELAWKKFRRRVGVRCTRAP